MAVQKRKRGDKLENNRVKTTILLLLSQGTVTKGGIMDHLREKHNVRDPKTIGDHLKDLVKSRLIQKEEIANGFPVSYHLVSRYKGFKDTFQFIQDDGSKIQFLASPYAQQMLSPSILPKIAEDLLCAANAHAPHEKKIPNNLIRNLSRSDLYDVPLPRENPYGMADSSEDGAFSFHLSSSMVNAVFPANAIDEIVTILRVSPKAVNFLITLTDPNSITEKGLMKAYQGLLSYYPGYYEKVLPELRGQFKPSIDKAARTPIAPLENIAFLHILRAYFIIDFLSDNVVEGSLSADLFNKLTSNTGRIAQ